MKLKFTNLVYQNYTQKYKDTDLNYYIIKNLENQIDFGLKEFKINNEDKIENKIEEIVSYLNSNIHRHFNIKSEDYFYEKKENDIYFNDININAIDINYSFNKKFSLSNMIGYLDFNDELYAIYDNSLIQFMSKKDNKFKFEIREKDLNNIKSCQKNEKNKILVLTDKHLLFIQILENSDYIIKDKYTDSIKIFEFNSSLDLIYYKNNYIYFSLFPNYSEEKVLTDQFYNSINKFQFIDDNLFFIFQNDSISSYSIKNYKAQKLNSTNEIKLNAQFSEIIDLNNFYAINNLNQIYILNKKNLTINKTININISLNKYIDKINFYYSYYFTFLLKISDSIITLFVSDNNNNIVIFQNYQISMSGIKWEFKKEENILKNTGINSIKMHNNNVLFLGNYNSYLIDIKKLKEDIKKK